MVVHEGCSEAVRTLPEVYGQCRKPQGSIGMVVGEGQLVCGYSQIFPEVYTDNSNGVYGW